MGQSVSIEMLPADHGDALYVSYGDELERHHLWIDGGLGQSFSKGWAKRVRQLGAQGAALDVLVVTHFDTDHINGVQAFIRANHKGGHADAIIPVRQVWFNQYRHVREYGGPRAMPAEPASSGAPRWATRLDFLREVALRAVPLAPLAARLAISAPKGFAEALRGPAEASKLTDLLGGHYPSNEAFQGHAVVRTVVPPEIPLPGGARAWVLSPTPEGLAALYGAWEAYLAKRNLVRLLEVRGVSPASDGDALVPGFVQQVALRAGEDLEPPLEGRKEDLGLPIKLLAERCFREDDRPANGSSIALLLEYAGHRLLLPGDAHPSDLVEGLSKLGFSAGSPVELDAVKLAHHGSRANTSPELLALMRCDRYLVSTNGEAFNHPDKECLARVIWANQDRPGTTLFFNYPGTPAELAIANEADQKAYGYRIEHLDQGRSLVLGE
jgi:hypothetical protein